MALGWQPVTIAKHVGVHMVMPEKKYYHSYHNTGVRLIEKIFGISKNISSYPDEKKTFILLCSNAISCIIQ